MPRVALTTLGCKVNQFETEVIEGLFANRGYHIVDFHDYADIYVINTCSVTHLGEKKSRQLIRRAIRNNRQATIVVTGCYAQVSPEQVAAIEGVDVIIGTQDRARIVDIVEDSILSGQHVNLVGNIMNAEHFEDIPLLTSPNRTRAFLKIQEGCVNFCSYCIIPYARGKLRSRSLESVRREAEKLVQGGFDEIVLTGIHLGAYGREVNNGITLVDAVKTVLHVEGLMRLRLGSLESIEVSSELIDIMKSDARLCRHLHLPLQAGDDRVLAMMNRPYTTEEYRGLIEKIKTQIPFIAISTDVIVGFPGETQEMFENSQRFIDAMDFSQMHIFPYSPRKGTPAALYPEQIPEQVKRQRACQLEILAKQKAAAYREKHIGLIKEVLFEAFDNDVKSGLTDNYLRVYCEHHVGNEKRLQDVRVQKLYEDGLWGTAIAENSHI